MHNGRPKMVIFHLSPRGTRNANENKNSHADLNLNYLGLKKVSNIQ